MWRPAPSVCKWKKNILFYLWNCRRKCIFCRTAWKPIFSIQTVLQKKLRNKLLLAIHDYYLCLKCFSLGWIINDFFLVIHPIKVIFGPLINFRFCAVHVSRTNHAQTIRNVSMGNEWLQPKQFTILCCNLLFSNYFMRLYQRKLQLFHLLSFMQMLRESCYISLEFQTCTANADYILAFLIVRHIPFTPKNPYYNQLFLAISNFRIKHNGIIKISAIWALWPKWRRCWHVVIHYHYYKSQLHGPKWETICARKTVQASEPPICIDPPLHYNISIIRETVFSDITLMASITIYSVIGQLKGCYRWISSGKLTFNAANKHEF